MSSDKKFVVKKDSKTDVITYMEYEKLKGFNVKPKKNSSFEEMINVNEMIIINPSLIEKLIDKKCTRTFERLLAMLTVVSEDDSDDDDSGYMMILDEASKFRNLIVSKYKDYMEEKEYELILKKLEILMQEVEYRRRIILEKQIEQEVSRKGKSSR